MFQNVSWHPFLTGALCGVVVTTVVGGALIWWQLHPTRSAKDAAIYDGCLVQQNGNTVACEALLRVFHRDRDRAAVVKKQAAQMLAAGMSKRDVVKWVEDNGLVGSDISDAVGISLQDLRSGNY